MSQKSNKKVQTKSSNNSVVHECNQTAQHRIVIIRGGIPTASRWFEFREIAVHGVYRALAYEYPGLPIGVFRVSPVAHEVLA